MRDAELAGGVGGVVLTLVVDQPDAVDDIVWNLPYVAANVFSALYAGNTTTSFLPTVILPERSGSDSDTSHGRILRSNRLIQAVRPRGTRGAGTRARDQQSTEGQAGEAMLYRAPWPSPPVRSKL